MAKATTKPFHAFWLFFPAAAVWAALVVPLSINAVLSGSGWPAGLLGAGHGHELIFGFALALIAGYTLGPQPWKVLAPLFLLWLAARLCWVLLPASLVSQLLSPAFALLLARYAVPRFQAAKKWRNKIAGPLILVLCLLSVIFWIAAAAPPDFELPVPDTRRIMMAAILGLLLLMTFMGGRIIAPAVAGTLEKRGIPIEARVQPRIEGALLVILPAALILVFMPLADSVTGLLLVSSAALIVIRTARWKLSYCVNRHDLLVLAIGYFWLAGGAGITGVRLLQGIDPLPALHVITIGALGTLSLSVMLRLAWQRARRTFPPAWQVHGIAFAMAVAVLARLYAGATPFAHPEALWISALAWATAYGMVAILLLTLFHHSQQRRK
ncbi:NnrS family protein [Marinobacter sp. M216]|uniref:NnrS family protein n=1 Tax=Marinobacter albus TaxID=3030833 RepID=A0ABT7H8N8_9GAMM|nr:MULTISPECIES: NnrS family protein [unclassified Marinobacter]MBW7471008.1 NnrS family protein [Marinobacter sp. F4218]MDK9556712.1 NnrS family protein [Marinobacter sp. M216]